jgi:hypothetical protein
MATVPADSPSCARRFLSPYFLSLILHQLSESVILRLAILDTNAICPATSHDSSSLATYCDEVRHGQPRIVAPGKVFLLPSNPNCMHVRMVLVQPLPPAQQVLAGLGERQCTHGIKVKVQLLRKGRKGRKGSRGQQSFESEA